jgi:hypothetical protein
MTIAIWVFSALLIAEFVMAPINLRIGRTMSTFTTFTGFTPHIARRVFAPVKLASAALVSVGLVVRAAGIAGAVAITAVCLVHLARSPSPGSPAGASQPSPGPAIWILSTAPAPRTC